MLDPVTTAKPPAGEHAMTAATPGPPKRGSWVIGSAVAAGAGAVFWIVAARRYGEAELGRNAAVLAAIVVAGGVAQLIAMHLIVAVARPRTRPRVASACLAAAAVAAFAGLAFAVTAPWWSPEVAGLLSGPGAVAACAGACAVWAVFVLQEGILSMVGSRVVPPSTLGFAVFKLCLLPVAAALGVTGGIAVSWMTAAVVIAVLTGAFLFADNSRVGRMAGPVTGDLPVRPPATQVWGEIAGASWWLVWTQLLPLVVLLSLGAAQAGVFAVVWAISYPLYLIPASLARSLVTLPVTDAGTVTGARAAIERRSLLVLAPLVVALAAATPWVLWLPGPDYSAAGRWLLPLLALAALPNVVVSAAVRQARELRRIGVAGLVTGSLSVLVVGLSVLLMPVFDLAGAGLAMFAGQSALAVTILLLRAEWLPRPIVGPLAGARDRGLIRRAAPRVLAARSWRPHRRLPGWADCAAVTAGPSGEPLARLQAAETPGGRTVLQHEVYTLVHLEHDPRLDGWRQLLPRVLDAGYATGVYYTLQSLVPGAPACDRLTDPVRRARFTTAALATIGELHWRTARPLRVDHRVFSRFVTSPAALIRATVPPRDGPTVTGVVHELAGRLRDRWLPVGRIHGNYGPASVLVDTTEQVTGIIHWGQSAQDGPTALDVVSLLVSTEAKATRREPGTVINGWLAAGSPAPLDDIVDSQRTLGGDPVSPRALLVLGWLHIVSSRLVSSARYAANPAWLRRNVVAVLRALAEEQTEGRRM